MEKNQLKMYDAPIVEVVEMEAKIALLAGSSELDPQEPAEEW